MNINDAFPSKYLKAADIKGRPPVAVVIREVTSEEMNEGKGDYKPVVWFHNKEKGVVLNKTNASMIAHTYGPETSAWTGKTILLRSEPVPFAGNIVDSIRVAAAQAESYAAEQQATAQSLEQQPEHPEPDFDDDIPF